MAPIEVGGPGLIVVVRPTGELDFAEDEHLRKALDLACERTSELVVVDCTGVEFIDSTALGSFVRAGKRLQEEGCKLQLVHVPATMERVIKIVKLWEYFDARTASDDLDMHVDLALAWTDDADLRVTFG